MRRKSGKRLRKRAPSYSSLRTPLKSDSALDSSLCNSMQSRELKSIGMPGCESERNAWLSTGAIGSRTKKRKTHKRRSRPELLLAAALRKAGVSEWHEEYRFHPVRRWQFDFAWPDLMVAAEVEGGVFVGGRHTRGIGFVKDCEKYNTATELGWSVFRLPPRAGWIDDAVSLIVRVTCKERIQ